MLDLDRHNFEQIFTSDGASAFIQSMRQSGCTVLRHTLPAHLWRRSASAARRLFDLPQVDKERLRSETPLTPGFSAYGQARALDTGVSNLLEGWVISPSSARGTPPDHTDDWFVLATFTRALRYVADVSLAALDFALDGGGYLIGGAREEKPHLQLLYYPKALLGKDRDARRQSIHIDSSIITVMPRSTASGLQIEVGGAMLSVDIADHEAVVIAGSVLQFLTCGRIQAARHTVTTPQSPEDGEDRLSIVYMTDPRPGMKLTPLDSCLTGSDDANLLDVDMHQHSYTQRVFKPLKFPL